MPYVSTMEIYQDGLQKGYGTPMFNCINYEMIRWAIEAAEEVGMPVLIGHFYGFETNMDPAVAEMVTKYYASKVKVPVAFHLDHCPTAEICISRMKHFDSVMIDGSHYDFEENVRLTKEVADIAHKMGIVVEAELGTVLQYVLDDKGYRLAGAYEKGDKVPVQVLEGCTIDLDEIFSE